MLCRDIILCFQDAALRVATKQTGECFVNPPCGCAHPGQELQCEECHYLEACLSRCKKEKLSFKSAS